MIPKIIHYCWFGSGRMSDLECQCIASWQNHSPDYKVKLWNEENFDVNSLSFTKEAYRLGKYAFVSDVARLFALKQEGGIYLDTDMLMLKPISDLLTDDIFLGDHEYGKIGLGIIGSVKNNLLINKVLDAYKELSFDLYKPKLIPALFDELLEVERKNLKIYPPDFFYPLPFKSKGQDFSLFLTQNSYAVHLWNHSWKDEFSLLREGRFIKSFYLFMNHLAFNPISYGNKLYFKRYIIEFKRNIKRYLKLKWIVKS